MSILHDPAFYAVASIAVLLVGIGKGGFGGGLGSVGVPIMALAIPATQAAAILLPVLCLMDLVGLITYRQRFDRRMMRMLFPGAVLGIALGAATFAVTSDHVVGLLVGALAVGFTLDRWFGPRLRRIEETAARPGPAKAAFWSSLAGYTSFVAHAGGPPLNVLLLPQRLDKSVYVGTTVMFFALANYVKLIPYAVIGQFEGVNLGTSLLLAPLAPVGFGLGYLFNQRVDEGMFYRIAYGALFLTGLKLLWDSRTVLGL
ncbi:MAG: sulfite exporter TauE/SafE family protein [Dehalococcoidia bacterium]|nr:MAG: sulfite exporter TauE/SafE family protein [Dehalococcoidia bacterium]